MSPIKITGNVPTTARATTGLWALDQALAGFNGTAGVPLLGGIEIYGKWETGKSTLAYYLAGCVKPKGKVILCDLEGGARDDYLIKALAQSGFSGELIYIEHEDDEGEMRTHESMMQEAAEHLYDENVGCMILDSAGAVRPIMEKEGDLGESFMGRRAQSLAQFSRRWGQIVQWRGADQLVIVCNHQLRDFEGYGYYSPGGDTPKFWMNAQLWILRRETFDNGDFVSELRVKKLRFGGRSKDRTFEIFFLQGVGVSPELSNLWAIMDMKYARRQSKGGKATGMVQYKKEKKGDEWVDVCKLSTLFEQARNGKMDTSWIEERLTWK